MWGEKLANGSWNGQVGMLGRGESDLAISNRYITSYLGRFDFEHYSAPYEFDVRGVTAFQMGFRCCSLFIIFLPFLNYDFSEITLNISPIRI